MALTIATVATDVIDFGSAVGTTLSKFTVWGWFRTATLSNNKAFWGKGATTSMRYFIHASAGNVTFKVPRATTATTYTTNDAPLSSNTWHFWSATFDSSVTPVAHIYVAQFGNALVERTYGTSTDGTGGLSADTGANFLLGVNGNFSGQAGRHAFIGYVADVLNLGQLKSLMAHPRVVASNKLFCSVGFNGTGTQADWSGNGNNGTVTGATVGAHVPIRPIFGGFAGWRGSYTTPSGSLVTLTISTVTSTATPTIVRNPSRVVSTVTGTGTSSIVRQPNRIASATSTGTPTLVRAAQRLLALVTGTGTAGVIRQPQRVVSTVTSTGTPSIVQSLQRIISVISTATASLIRQPNRIIGAVTATGTATVTTVKLVLFTVATVTATGTATIIRQVQRIVSATGTGTPSVVRLAARIISTVTATGSATVTSLKVILLTIATVTATGTASVTRQAQRVIVATATGSPTMVRLVSRVVAATATATPVILRLSKRIFSAIANGIASVLTAIIGNQPTPGSRTYVVPADTRTFTPPEDGRTFTPPTDDRTFIV
jgi:hypothetical protein